MTEHAIKIKEVYFKAVLSGEKTFEIRKNDRDYQVGDIIHFVPVDDECGMIIPHDPNAYKITYVFHGGEYGLEEGFCVFGIAPEAHDKEIGDLISREAVIDVLKQTGIIQDNDLGHCVVDEINRISTAYDHGKVVAEIQKEYCQKCRNILSVPNAEKYCKSVNCDIGTICDIVKRGGVE